MFLREHRVKRKGKSYTYLKLVESLWSDGRPRQRVLVNLGSRDLWTPEKIAQFQAHLARLAGPGPAPKPNPVHGGKVWEFGEALALQSVWDRLRVSEHLASCLAPFPVHFDVAGAIRVMVFNRLMDPQSKLGLCAWQKRYFFPSLGVPGFQAQHYCRALDYLIQIKERLEARLWNQTQTLFNSQATLVFYDMTSCYFEGAMGQSDRAAFGRSKDGRANSKQVMIGLLVNNQGMPITHHVFAGNIRDNATVPAVTADLAQRFDIRHCIFVADCGTLDAKTVKALRDAGRRYDYITSVKLRRHGEGEALVEQLPDREHFRRLSPDEWIHVIAPGQDDQGRPLRYVATYHPKSARDGLQILKTDSATLTDEEVVRGYRTLWRVERAFRELKDNIDLRPNYHHTDSRIAAHVFVCVLAYLMENAIDALLDRARSPHSARTALERLRTTHVVHLPVINRPVRYVIPPDPENRKLLQALGLEKIPTIV